MKDSNHLYVVEAGEWHQLPYKEALEKKIQLGRDLVIELQEVPIMQRNDSRIYDAIKAIKHNANLLKEAE